MAINTSVEFDVSELIEGQKISVYQIWTMALMCAVMFIDGYDMQVLGYAAPALLKAWHIQKGQLGAVFGVSMAGFMVGATLLGQLGDRFGRKKMIVGGTIVFGVCTVMTGLATTLSALIYLRLIAGVGLGGTLPNCIALNAEFAPAKTRGTKISTMYVGYTLGSALSGVIAAKYIPAYGWQIAFLIGGIVPLILAPILTVGLPESVRYLAMKQRNPENLARILSRFRPDLQFSSSTRFVTKEKKQVGVPVRFLFTEGRAWVTSTLWLAVVGSLMALHFFTSWLPTVMESSGVPMSSAIMTTALFQVGGMIGCVFVGILLDKYGVIAIVGALIVAIPFILSIGSIGPAKYLLMVLVFSGGFFLIGAQVAQIGLPGMIYPTYIRATGSGWTYGIGRFGSILGPVIGGFLLGMDLSLPKLFLFATFPVVGSALATYLMSLSGQAQTNMDVLSETGD